MRTYLITAATCLGFAVPACAAPHQPAGSIVVAQTSAGTPAGGPSKDVYVVPNGATGGQSGGPDQQKYKVPKKKKKMAKPD